MKILRKAPVLSAVVLFAIRASAQVKGSTFSFPNLPTTTQNTAGNSKATNTPQTTDPKASVTSGAITGSGSQTSTGSVPSITGSSANNGGALPTGLPTLTGAFTIVPPSVPPTANAPYMQTSKLPEGTVFIAVGAILGFLAMSMLLSRGLVAWSLHRSVKRAALQQDTVDSKAFIRTPGLSPPTFYNYSDRDSSISLSGLGHKSGKKGARPNTSQGGGAATSNLFFSPTAGAANAGLPNPGNRGSNYLPAGYYAASAAAAGAGQSHVPLGAGHGPSISLSHLGQQGQGYARARNMGPSPPDSPAFGATDSGHMTSRSTLDLNRSYGANERAPSAFLEDLIDGENAQHGPGKGQQRAGAKSPHRY